MWKKPETDMSTQSYELGSKQSSPTPQPTKTSSAVIGASIIVKGEITGKEPLLVEGRVEGTLRLSTDTVTIGQGGSVSGDIHANMIQVRGNVVGDLFGNETVIVHQTGSVRGNITAPRVTLEDGAKLKGAIDMDPQTAHATRAASSTLESTIKTNENAARNVESLEKIAKKTESDTTNKSFQGLSKSIV